MRDKFEGEIQSEDVKDMSYNVSLYLWVYLRPCHTDTLQGVATTSFY